jgi:predicted DCC family thiol-disulfide oxidoreductase YuxK
MRRLDYRAHVSFIDITVAAQCPEQRTVMLLRLHASENGGDLLTGAAAFAAMWRAIPILRPLGLLARNRPVLWLLEHCYRGFLRVRPTLQRRMRHFEAGSWSARRHDGA